MPTYLAADGRNYPISSKCDLSDPNWRRILERVVEVLDGRDYRELFGPDATLDQVHGSLWKPDTCGCAIEYLFDHYAAIEGQQFNHHPHRLRERCHVHQHLDGVNSLHTVVQDENQRKNLAVGFVAEMAEIDPKVVSWTLNDDREVVIVLPQDSKFNDRFKQRVRRRLNEEFTSHRVHVL